MNPATVYLDWPDARMDSVGSNDMQQSDMNHKHRHTFKQALCTLRVANTFKRLVTQMVVKGGRTGAACGS